MSEIVIKATAKFQKEAKKLLSDEDLERLYDYLSLNPSSGAVIRSTGGVRKLRWSPKSSNKGKSGGLRVLYHYSNNILILLLGAYPKSEIDNISDADKNTLKKLIPQLIERFKEEL